MSGKVDGLHDLIRSNLRRSHEDRAVLDYEIFCFHVAEKSCGGSQDNCAFGMDIRHQFTADLGTAYWQIGVPTEMFAKGNDEPRGFEAALDVGAGINLQRTFGDELAVEFSLDHRFADNRIGVEDKTLSLDHETS